MRACSTELTSTSRQAASVKAYENLSRNATTLKRSPELRRSSASSTALRQELRRSLPMEPDASSINTMSFDTIGRGLEAFDATRTRKYFRLGFFGSTQ